VSYLYTHCSKFANAKLKDLFLKKRLLETNFILYQPQIRLQIHFSKQIIEGGLRVIIILLIGSDLRRSLKLVESIRISRNWCKASCVLSSLIITLVGDLINILVLVHLILLVHHLLLELHLLLLMPLD
jgi:hypothetical protein